MTGIIICTLNIKYFFLLYGPSNTGKSQLAVFLQELIGKAYSLSIRSINDLGDRWTTGNMFGKKLCTCLDIPNHSLSAETISSLKM